MAEKKKRKTPKPRPTPAEKALYEQLDAKRHRVIEAFSKIPVDRSMEYVYSYIGGEMDLRDESEVEKAVKPIRKKMAGLLSETLITHVNKNPWAVMHVLINETLILLAAMIASLPEEVYAQEIEILEAEAAGVYLNQGNNEDDVAYR